MTFLTHKNATVNHHEATLIYLGKDCSLSGYCDSSKWLVVIRRKKGRDQKTRSTETLEEKQEASG